MKGQRRRGAGAVQGQHRGSARQCKISLALRPRAPQGRYKISLLVRPRTVQGQRKAADICIQADVPK